MIDEIARLRRRLTAWYALTLGAIVVVLGAGLFLAVRHQIAEHLDDSLRGAAATVARATDIREQERATARGQVVDAVAELRVPDRDLFLFDMRGDALVPSRAPEWLRAAALAALRDSAVFTERETIPDRTLRAFVERFTSRAGNTYVAAAVADRVELEDQYSTLILSFGGAALTALVLFAVVGSFLTRKSVEPVARTLDSMRRFMGDAAHELRTPITVLRSRAEVALARDAHPGDNRDTLVAIEHEAVRLGNIVENLLLLARSDAGARPVARESVYLDDVASDAVSAAQPLAERAGVTLRIAGFEEAPVTADPALLHQLVVIILDNAIKFTPAGGSVDLSVNQTADGAVLSISDTGVGISQDQLAHVFERFYRGDTARSRGEGLSGAGLGLSIAQWIADAHGARIAIESEPGVGTTVSVRFPSVS